MANGCGKTTTIGMMLGLVSPTEGSTIEKKILTHSDETKY